MGDRGTVDLDYGDGKKVYLYTHWGRYNLGETVQNALKRGRRRWNDQPYLARIIFSEMIQDDVLEETGFGLDVELGDGDETVVIDLNNCTVSYKGSEPTSYGNFIMIMDVDLTEDES